MKKQWLFGAIIFLLAAHLNAPAQQRDLDTRLSELERRVSALEQRIGNAPQNSPVGQSRAEEGRQSFTRQSGAPIASIGNSGAQHAVPLSVTLVEKTLQKAGPGEACDQLGFQFEFQNIGKEHITSFKGEIVIRGADGEKLQTFPFDIAEYVAVSKKTSWYSSFAFSAVNRIHRALYTSDLSQLQVALHLSEVMYYDTRVERFE